MVGVSGLLSREIVARLAAAGAEVRVAVRHCEDASFLMEGYSAGCIIPSYADVTDETSVASAVDDADAVVNTVGHHVECGRATFEAIHGRGELHVTRAPARAGVGRVTSQNPETGFAIRRGRNGRRHDVDFGADRITVDVASSESTIQITVDMPDFPAPSHRRPFATLAVPRDALLAALHASLGSSGPGPGRTPLRIIPNDAGDGA